MSGLFGRKKKRPLVVPPPPHGDLLTFPSAPEAGEEGLLKMGEEPKPDKVEPMIEDSEFLPDDKEMSSDSSMNQSSTFIKIDTFQSVINEVMDLRLRLEKSGKIVARLEEVQEQQNNLLKLWHHNIKTVHEKLIYADEILFKRG